MTTRNRSMTVLTLAAVAMATLVLTSTAASAATVSVLQYHAYDDTARGANTISPFASIFGTIFEQDVTVESGFTLNIPSYDFRGLSAAPVPAGQTYFFLEDLEDGQFDVPGVTVTGSTNTPRTDNGRNGSANSTAQFTDSVDEDDAGGADGVEGAPAGSYRTTFITDIMRYTFNEGVLGALPTHVGIALGEEKSGKLTAYDSGDNILDTITVGHPGGVFHQFVGVIDESGIGIAYVEVTGEKETDHFQYGRVGQAIPEPSTFVLAALGLLGLLGFRRRRRRR